MSYFEGIRGIASSFVGGGRGRSSTQPSIDESGQMKPSQVHREDGKSKDQRNQQPQAPKKVSSRQASAAIGAGYQMGARMIDDDDSGEM